MLDPEIYRGQCFIYIKSLNGSLLVHHQHQKAALELSCPSANDKMFPVITIVKNSK